MGHRCCRMFLILLTTVVFVCVLVLAYLASSDVGIKGGLYLNRTGDISDKYNIRITPASWTFALWGIIFAWQCVWLIYVLTTLCRRVPDETDRYLYQLPIHPPVFFIFYILNNGVTLAWQFIWDRQWIGGALIDIVFCPLTLVVCLVISVIRLYQNIPALKSVGLNKEIWFIRFFVQNGLCIFLTWLTIATILNFCIVLTYSWGVDNEVASLIGLGILSLEILVWVLLDTFLLDKYFRYIFTPHFVLVFALAGIMSRNFNTETNYRVSIYVAVLLGVAVFALVKKLFLMVWRHCRQPIKGNISDKLKGNLA